MINAKGRKLKIPLAWLQLSWDKLRLCAAVSGIIFAVVLMMMQLGFRDALFEAAVQVHKQFDGDLVIVNRQYEYLIATKVFDDQHLHRTLAVDGVASVAPIYVGLANWRAVEGDREMPIFLIGINPDTDAIRLPEVRRQRETLKLPDTVLFDTGTKKVFGPVTRRIREGATVETELAGRRVKVAGLFTLGISFGSDGNLISSDLNFLRFVPGRTRDQIDVGLIRLAPGADPETVIENVAAMLPENLRVLTLEGFMDYEKEYWAKRTPIGFIFSVGVLVGFIVGTVIVYQILYTDVADHLSEYATLKAIGYNNKYLSGVVIRQSVLLAVLGFVPGLVIATGMSIMTRKVTLLPAYMTWERSTLVLFLTVGMCVVSGLLAMRKLRSADPADIF